MSRIDAADLAQRLGEQAEDVCRHYLSNGRRQGNYWLVGDVRNAAGRSMFVRLKGPAAGKGAAGKWQDPAEGSHGDLLDVIRESLGLSDFPDVLEEARRFLSLPRQHPVPKTTTPKQPAAPTGSSEAARRLLSMASPLKGSLAATYLRGRGISDQRDTGALRCHPNCYYRGEGEDQTEIWPAMIAAVTDLEGKVTGAHRTWLARDGGGKAPVDTQRKAMGVLLGHAVRFGVAKEVMAAGEGIETVLSLRQALSKMPIVAALSAGHLAALQFPADLRRLYIVRDNDPAGDGARESLIARAHEAGIEALTLSPMAGDFNDDLTTRGLDAIRAYIRAQLAPEDVSRFLGNDPLMRRRG
jgi:hypothetical protein